MRQVGLIKPDRAGEAVKLLPALRALRAAAPGIDVHLLASEENASLFEHEPGVTLHVLSRHWKKMKLDKIVASMTPTSGYPYHTLINLVTEKPETFQSLLLAIPAERRFSPGIENPSVKKIELNPAGTYETENLAAILSDALDMALIESARRFPERPFLVDSDTSEAFEKMGVKEGMWLGFFPFRGKSHRDEPLRRWEKLIARATTSPEFEKFFLFGLPKDYQFLEKLRHCSPRKDVIEFAFPSNFRAMAAYFERLDGVVAVDSGPLHLARAVGANVFGILSSGDHERWYGEPRENEVFVKRGFLGRAPSILELGWSFDRWVQTIRPDQTMTDLPSPISATV